MKEDTSPDGLNQIQAIREAVDRIGCIHELHLEEGEARNDPAVATTVHGIGVGRGDYLTGHAVRAIVGSHSLKHGLIARIPDALEGPVRTCDERVGVDVACRAAR